MAVSKLNPLTEITLYKLTDIDRTYTNVHRFKDRAERDSYFRLSKNDPLDFNEVKPVRIGGRTIRLNMEMDKVLYYNYLSFKNLNYDENRIYYCFIANVDWININCCEIEFEIDVWATYYFDVLFTQVYVERSHYWCSTQEQIGDNIEPEDFQYGDYQFLVQQRFFTDCVPNSIVVWYAEDGHDRMQFGYNYFAAATFEHFLINPLGISQASELLNRLGDRVFLVHQAPTVCFLSENIRQGTYERDEDLSFTYPTDKIGDYTPRNKKLFTFPYNYLMIFTSGGESKIYKYEYFIDKKIIFHEIVTGTPDGGTSVYPTTYKGHVFDDRLILGDYPLNVYSQNAANSWLANGGLATSIAKIGAGALLGASFVPASKDFGYSPAMGATAGALTGLTGLMVEGISQAFKPPIISGSIKSSSDVVSDRYGFYYARVALQETELARIDEYFNRYGYSDNSIRKVDPMICNLWCYWKTEGNPVVSIDYTSMGGGVPAWAIEIMNNCFHNGITFWDAYRAFGDYRGENRDDRPISPVEPYSDEQILSSMINSERSENSDSTEELDKSLSV